MAKKKAKWLEESTNQELISEVMEKVLLGDEIEKKDTTRAVKALEELQERLPSEGEEVSLEEALSDMEKAILEGIQKAKDAYNSELEAITEEETDEDEEEDIEDSDEDDDDEDIEDEDIEETDEEGYEDLTVKELRAECRKRGIPVKGLKKPGMIEALQGLDEDDDEDIEDEDIEDEDIEETEDIEEEETDEEETDEDEEDMDYEELSTRALKELMKDRGIKVKKGMKKQELIKALEADDQE